MSEMMLMIAGRNGLECICGRQGHGAALCGKKGRVYAE